jgi:hypothetical protein
MSVRKIHFLELPDYFFSQLFDELHKINKQSEVRDPIIALFYCFNYKLNYKLLHSATSIIVRTKNQNLFKNMLRLQSAIYEVIPNFFHESLIMLDIRKHTHISADYTSIYRDQFTSFPPNLTCLRTSTLFADEFCLLPESLTCLKIYSSQYAAYKTQPQINFSLPNLLKLTISGVSEPKIFNGIMEHLPENLEKLDIFGFAPNNFELPTHLKKLTSITIIPACYIGSVLDLKVLPQTLTSISVDFDYVSWHSDEIGNWDNEFIAYVEHFPLLKILHSRIDIKIFKTNIFHRFSDLLEEFGFCDIWGSSVRYREVTFVRTKDEWVNKNIFDGTDDDGHVLTFENN